MSKFLLLLGPSGVGKSSIIKEILKLDNRFIYISPFMTRPLRKGEKDKVFASEEKINKMWGRGDLLAINIIYGIRYATPKKPIKRALKKGNFPILDWPINKIEVMMQAFPNQLCIVYIIPPSIDSLKKRLAKDGRDTDGLRLKNAIKELRDYKSSKYKGVCDLKIISEENRVREIAQKIYNHYLESFQKNSRREPTNCPKD